MPGATTAERARQLEIVLDAVGTYASSDSSWLLDERFEALLAPGQREWAASLRDLADRIERADASSLAWHQLATRLREFGA